SRRDVMQRRTNIALFLVSVAVLAPDRGQAAPSPDNPRVVRVLVVGDVPTREYQFVRALLQREAQAKSVELTQHLQSYGGRNRTGEEVWADRVLAEFPGRLEDPEKEMDLKEGERMLNLRSYDVVIAFDPSWGKLSDAQRENLNGWVKEWGG